MKNKLLRGGCLVLVILLLLPVAVGCRNNGKQPPNSQEPVTSGSEEPATSGSDQSPTDPDSEDILVAEDGKVIYRIVYPDGGANLFYEFANAISEMIRKQVGSAPRVQKESVAQIAQPQPTIYIGMTKALRNTGLADGMGYGDYRVGTADGDIYIAAYSYSALSKATEHFNRRLRHGLENGSIILHNYERTEQVDERLNAIPFCGNADIAWAYSVGEDTCQVVIPGAESSDYEEYLTQLEKLSYTRSVRRSANGGEYATYTGSGQALFVSLLNSELRIVSEPTEQAFLPPAGKQSFDKKCDTTGYLLGVYGGGAYENGMSMFFLLADGSFLIFDGGHNESDATQLFSTLSDAAEQNGLSRIRISAWIITHAHSDHTGMFPHFLRKYGGRIVLEKVFLNRITEEQGSAAGSGIAGAEEAVLSAVRTYSPQTAVHRLQTGQEFWLADVRVEVLYTAADLRQGVLSDYNDASTVVRIEVNGKTMLITGDAAAGAWKTMVENYGKALKSDYLQVPHHGAAPGGTVEAYDLIDPDALYWPAGENLYNALLKNMNPQVCKHLIGMVSSDRIYLAGVLGMVTAIPFS